MGNVVKKRLVVADTNFLTKEELVNDLLDAAKSNGWDKFSAKHVDLDVDCDYSDFEQSVTTYITNESDNELKNYLLKPAEKKHGFTFTEQLSTSNDRENSDIWNDFCQQLSKLAEPIFRKNRKQWKEESDSIKNINISSGNINDEIKEAIKKDCDYDDGYDDYGVTRSYIYRCLDQAINKKEWNKTFFNQYVKQDIKDLHEEEDLTHYMRYTYSELKEEAIEQTVKMLSPKIDTVKKQIVQHIHSKYMPKESYKKIFEAFDDCFKFDRNNIAIRTLADYLKSDLRSSILYQQKHKNEGNIVQKFLRKLFK